MQRLPDYIFEARLKERDRYMKPTAYSVDEFLRINNLTEDNINALDWYSKYVCEGTDWYIDHIRDAASDAPPERIIMEMLRSISSAKLKDVLNKRLGARRGLGITFMPPAPENPCVACDLVVPGRLFNLKRIDSICDTMMWTLTLVEADGVNYNPHADVIPDTEEYIITVEPQLSENITAYVKKNCGGKLYHMVGDINAFDSIMRSGLRMKGENTAEYRYIKNRVYLVCGASEDELKDAIIRVAKTKNLWGKNGLAKTARFVEVDASDYNVNFYRDTTYDVRGICFSYAYFPPRLLRDATPEITKLLAPKD